MIQRISKDFLFRCVDISYLVGSNKIIDNISIELNRGEIVTIIGPNGGGKTTLAKIIIGIIKPSSGILEKKSGIKIGYMPQKLHFNNMLPMTAQDFLLLNKKNTSECIKVLSNKDLKPILHKQIHNLSGGELQKTLFARCFLNDPDLLILDEPTQGLDVPAQNDFYSYLNVLRKNFNKTILMISHDLHTVMSASDKIICLNRHIHCSGKPCDVKSDESYKKMFAISKGQMISTYTHKPHHKHCNE